MVIYASNTGYGSYNFNRDGDIRCGAYGGRDTDATPIKNVPVIFIHGNSDVGFGRGTQDGTYWIYSGYVAWQTGFRSLAGFLTSKGYTKAELYTTTWGVANPNGASSVYHSKEIVLRLRKFVEAVLDYTGAKQVDVIGHSMGVSLGRRIVKGGSTTDHSAGKYDVGPSLNSYVRRFIGLAGANQGLVACVSPTLATCGAVDGFFPGYTAVSGPSTFLKDLNNDGK